MLDLFISTESCCDLSNEIIKDNNIQVIDMSFMIDGIEYNTKTDDVETTKLYDKMREGKKTATTLVNTEGYLNHFRKLLKQNKDVIHLTLSSGLSSTLSSAITAANQLNSEFTNKVYVIDSLCGCSGQGMLAVFASRYKNQAKDIDDLLNYINDTKLKINHDFTVDSLKYLAAGGRIKPSAAFIGTILNIKPVMKMDNNGKLIVTQKVISRKKAINTIADNLKKKYDPKETLCYIAQAGCIADAEYLKHLIETQTTLNPIITNLGSIIGSHSGPGTLSVYYLADKR